LQVKSKLKGHTKRITGLAFSHVLNVLVSSGADAQVIIAYYNLSSEFGFSMVQLHKRTCGFGSLTGFCGNATPTVMIWAVNFVPCLLCRFVSGTRMDGKSRSLDSCSFLLGGHHRHNQIPVYSFIKIKYSSWLYMKLNLPFMKQQN